jgi:hypothetical protein
VIIGSASCVGSERICRFITKNSGVIQGTTVRTT